MLNWTCRDELPAACAELFRSYHSWLYVSSLIWEMRDVQMWCLGGGVSVSTTNSFHTASLMCWREQKKTNVSFFSDSSVTLSSFFLDSSVIKCNLYEHLQVHLPWLTVRMEWVHLRFLLWFNWLMLSQCSVSFQLFFVFTNTEMKLGILDFFFRFFKLLFIIITSYNPHFLCSLFFLFLVKHPRVHERHYIN